MLTLQGNKDQFGGEVLQFGSGPKQWGERGQQRARQAGDEASEFTPVCTIRLENSPK